jgi:hypothetical protein
MPQKVLDFNVSSLALKLVRAFVSSLRIEGLREPLSVLDGMRLRPDALLRRSPAFLVALDVVASELRHDAQESSAGRQSRFLSPPMRQTVTAAQVRRSLRTSVSSTKHLQSKAVQKAAKRNQLSLRPLPESRAAKSEPGKNCNGQNAKRKPLSGSSASSKTRS